ncbi:arylesterase [Aureibaculum algae]|uniref:Arylesterase n=1 Tax=Aureibaculum algae TaxID=2584122 RepID=A0A5B7TWA8_9FLAO|nr:arylesterase [Aureibaculum algae]QCX38942.1 arylesterase [Aureibaculum algae]
MITKIYDSFNPIFLKFCYFIIATVLISCRGDVAKKENTEEVKTTEGVATEKTDAKKILFFGDSLTAGYGLDDVNDAYPALIQSTIDSLGLDYTVINSGVSGETSAGGKSRIGWVLKQKVDVFVFVLELGANDGLRGIPLVETKANLQSIIDTVKEKMPEATIILAGMELPPNMGPEYTSEFRTVFSDLASENKLTFIPFILKDVGGVVELNQADGIHPTVEGHKIVAKTVWAALNKVIQ